MKCIYAFLVIVMFFVVGEGVGNAQNPYADGTSLADGTTITSTWSVATNTTVDAEGALEAKQKGTIYGELNVAGTFKAVSVDVYGTLTVQGDYTKNDWSGLHIYSGGVVEVFGDFSANQQITVDEGATLIIHGDLNASNTLTFNGNVVVVGSVTAQNTINIGSTGNLVIGEDLTAGNRVNIDGDNTDNIYFLDPDAVIDYPSNWGSQDLDSGYGDVDDFNSNESDNDVLNDILEEVGLISSIDTPTSFTFNDLSGTSAELSWVLNNDSDDVIIALYSSDSSGKPINGTSYAEGDVLSDNAEIIFVGSLQETSTTYASFVAGATNYVRIWSVGMANAVVTYSASVKLSVKALSTDDILYESFDGDDADGSYDGGTTGDPYTWTMDYDYGSTEWVVGTAESYVGSGSAYVSSDNGTSSSYNISNTANIDLSTTVKIGSGYKSAELTFYWKATGEGGYDGGAVKVNDGSGADYVVAYQSLYGQETWVEEAVDLTDYIGSEIDLDFNWYNNGRFGTNPGLCIDEVRVTGSEVARPESFGAAAASSSEINLTWEKSVDGDEVIIAYSSFGTIGRPESGVTYEIDDYLSGGGRVIYVGSDTEFTHSDDFQGALVYAIWSQKSSTYSSSLKATVQVPVALPFTEDFESGADNWVFNNGGCDNEWVLGSSTQHAGSNSVYISTDKGITAAFDAAATTYLELEVDLRNYTDATLSFWYKCNGKAYNSNYGCVYIDGSAVSSRYYYKTAWTEVILDSELDSYLGDIVTLQFMWTNGGYSDNPGFCVDDIYITGAIEVPSDFTATNDGTKNELTWSKNTYDNPDDVMVVWSTEDNFITPEEGVVYEAGDEIGDATVLYYGDLEAYTHSPLNYGTVYYYEAYSTRNGIYSRGITSSANTPSKVVIFEEDWEGGSDVGWSTTVSGSNSWLIEGSDTYSEGGASAYISYNSSDAEYDKSSTSTAWLQIDVDLNVVDLQTATLSFDWKSEGEIYNGTIYDYGEVYVNDGSSDVRISQQYEYYGNDTWESTSIDLSGYIGSSITLKYKWVNDGSLSDGPLGFCIDNLEVGGSYTAKSVLDNGIQLNASISSLANASADAVSVLSFDITDQTSSYNDATRVQQLVISKGSLNTIDNWSDAIAGAVLFGEGIGAAGIEGTITSATIAFTGTDMISLEDEQGTYTLQVWLNSDLNANDINDNDVFDFAVSSDDMVTGDGDDFIEGLLVKSGAVTIDVDATALLFTQQPSSYASVDYGLTQSPEVSAVDANGNVDIDFVNTVTITNSGSLGMLNASVSASAGVASFSSLLFTQTGTVTLDASYLGWSTGNSDEVIIQDYCIPTHAGNTRYINNAILSTLSNTSGDDGGYGLYVDQSTELTIGVEYDIDLGVYQASGTGYVYVWIDWDQSGIFDSDEKLSIGSSSSTGSIVAISGTLTVPDDQDAVAGATRMRVQFVQSSSPSDACGNSISGESEDYIVVLSTNGWLGSNNQWDIAQNWASGSIPTSGSDVYIPEHPYYSQIYPVIDGTAAMNDLEIASNASLTISAGSQVDIYGDIITNDGLVIENTIANPTTLITHKNGVSVAGTTNIQWPLTDMVWWYIGHSVSGVSESDYDDSFGDQDYALNIYDGAWERIAGINDIYTGDYPFSSPLEGYSMVLRNSGQTLSYNGVLNADDSYSDTFGSGLRLIANPYPAYIDVLDVSGYFTVTDFNQTVYIRRSDNLVSAYNLLVGDVSSSNEGSRYIAPGQCMWIRATSNSATVTIDKDARTHSHGGYGLKGATATSDEVLRLQLQSDYNADESVIIFNENGSDLYTAYDSEKVLNSGSNVNIYSIKDETDLVVNSLPELVADDVIVLGYSVANSGMSDFILSVTNIDDFMPSVNVYLQDKEADVTVNLRDSSSYTFTPSTTEVNDRFVLVFDIEESISTDIDQESVVSEENVMIYAINKKVTVRVTQELLQYNDRVIEVYDLVGQLIAEYEFNEIETAFELPRTHTMYIIKVSVDNYSYQEKVIGLN